MKFRQYMNYDKIKKKIEEEEKFSKKPRRIEECSISNDFQSKSDENTKTLNSIMNLTKRMLSSDTVTEKMGIILFIDDILTKHIERHCKEVVNSQNNKNDKDNESVFENKSNISRGKK